MVLPEEKEYTGYEERARQMAQQGSLQGVDNVLDWEPPTVPGTVAPDGSAVLQEQEQPAAAPLTGKLTADNMRAAVLGMDPYQMLEYSDPQRDEKRRQRLQRVANIEAIGNALAAVGGIASARRGGPVFAVDRTRADQALANMDQEEQEWAGTQRQQELFKLQQTIAMMAEKRQAQQRKDEMITSQEFQRGLAEDQIAARKKEADEQHARNIEILDKQGAQNVQGIGARTAGQLRVEEQRTERLRTQATQRASANYNRANPRAVTLQQTSPDGQVVTVGELRETQFENLVTALVNTPAVKNAITQSGDISLSTTLRVGGTLSKDQKAKIVHQYWTHQRDLVRALMQSQDRELQDLEDIYMSGGTTTNSNDPEGLWSN